METEIARRVSALLRMEGVPLPAANLLQEWENALTVKEHKLSEKLLRKYLAPFLCKLPGNLRLVLTSALKRARNRQRRFPLNEESPVLIDRWILQNSGRSRPTFCFTADVDNRLGYDWMDRYLEIAAAEQIKLTVLLVTHYDYVPDREWLGHLDPQQVEVGLHCYDHDIGLAYRPESVIEYRLKKALERLPTGVRSYRSAALSLSESLFRVLARLGIQVDSSTSSHCSFYPSVQTTRAYFYIDPPLVELPLVIQDDYFFRDMSFSDEEALERLERFVSWLFKNGGNCTINFHPHNMRKRPAFLRESMRIMKQYYGKGSSRLMADYLRL